MLTKRIGALFMAVLFLLLFQPLSVYADQPLNSFLESDGNFYIYLENCTYIDSQKKEAPEEYGSSNYTDPYMYDIYVSDVPSDGNITIGFSSLYFIYILLPSKITENIHSRKRDLQKKILYSICKPKKEKKKL